MAMRTLLSSGTSSFQCGMKRTMNRALAQPTIEFNRNINFSHGINSRQIHSSSMLHQAKRQQDLFTPSPFARSSKINVSDKFVIHRDLKEPDNAYGIRRYLLLPRSHDDDELYNDDMTKKQIIASLNANRHILFGAQLNIKGNADDDNDEYMSKYLAACGSLLDIAKEDASINGQQVQALATLNGLCSWVKECLDNDGEGSQVLMGLMHGKKQTNDSIMDDNDSKKEEGNKLPSGKRANQKITNPSEDTFVIQKKTLRKNMLEAVRAIATGEPRPGHSVVGAGTYRDGEKGWVALAREYTQLATNPDSVSLDASYVGRKGLEEVALYKSRDGEVTKIEHLGHAEPGYLKEAGGAMARLFFV
eukprot:CAMPEP_0172323798 /NCGR_PEP_ID=MMETSP1058-20130122/49612_1 /TAXON_ID=83371 /ORGANISM="Detonula confervacea, Strain CCMP 353" /LENGTH=360 /DNA_ID=CAMNT_0013039895 /DNA_START=58 /DNA_END=1141 /DNA_ORIENTATION=-